MHLKKIGKTPGHVGLMHLQMLVNLQLFLSIILIALGCKTRPEIKKNEDTGKETVLKLEMSP
jgi:hypothetical protein